MKSSYTHNTPPWLLLIHQMPARPAALRVRLWRRLQALGAVAVKHAVHALPADARTREDFEWLRHEIVAMGGEAMICEARMLAGLADADVRALFDAGRNAAYAALAAQMRALDAELAQAGVVPASIRARLARLRAALAQAAAIDFFGAPGRVPVEQALAALDRRIGARAAVPRADPPGRLDRLRGRVWVTRQGVHVDRIASAWLIRRCIDPDARFRFVPDGAHAPAPDELRFDMFEAEFGHDGDRCTFEVLLGHIGSTEPALHAIAEIVHDIDLRDGKFARAETAGIAHLLTGLVAGCADDLQRIDRGGALLDDLRRSFGATGAAHPDLSAPDPIR